MSNISEFVKIHTDIAQTAFVCQQCGCCCTETEPGSNIVMTSPGEVRAIMKKTNLAFDEIVEPYPDAIEEDGRNYTFAWAIRRKDERCIFHENGHCSIYDVRPWICRTYPFMLDDDRLEVYPCPGITNERENRLETAKVHHIVIDLIKRQNAEKDEEERIKEVLTRVTIPAGKRVVIDGEGMRIING